MKIGFLSNQLDGRGTGNALYNYAHYNISILKNDSKIYTFPSGNHDKAAVEKFVNEFGVIYTPTPENLNDIDALYHIKSGEDNGFNPGNIPYLVHAVFKSEIHGTRYAAISEWMGIRDSIPFVPHIVDLANHSNNFRGVLNIPEDAIVFGRYGGHDTFDIGWVWESISSVLQAREDVYFIFLNTQPVIEHPRIMYFRHSLDENVKRAFINTCNAMIHARSRGETFGIAVGEFALLGKPIFTYGKSYEKAHIYELRGTAKIYNDKETLTTLLLNYDGSSNHPFYDRFTPELVMETFKEVFLD